MPFKLKYDANTIALLLFIYWIRNCPVCCLQTRYTSNNGMFVLWFTHNGLRDKRQILWYKYDKNRDIFKDKRLKQLPLLIDVRKFKAWPITKKNTSVLTDTFFSFNKDVSNRTNAYSRSVPLWIYLLNTHSQVLLNRIITLLPGHHLYHKKGAFRKTHEITWEMGPCCHVNK